MQVKRARMGRRLFHPAKCLITISIFELIKETCQQIFEKIFKTLDSILMQSKRRSNLPTYDVI